MKDQQKNRHIKNLKQQQQNTQMIYKLSVVQKALTRLHQNGHSVIAINLTTGDTTPYLHIERPTEKDRIRDMAQPIGSKMFVEQKTFGRLTHYAIWDETPKKGATNA